MIIGEYLSKFGFDLTKLSLTAGFLQAEFEPVSDDEDAAWEMYVQLITRILTQKLEYGVEATALESVYKLFDYTRNILIRRGKKAQGFSKIAVAVINQVVRPFTAKWHRLSVDGAFDDPDQCELFRSELADLQIELRKYAKLLADMAKVEDIVDITIDDICY